MSDHAIGLIGLALAVISIIAPFRWPNMHRLVTDLGLIAGTLLFALALFPYGQPSFPSVTKRTNVPVQQPRSAADQKEIDALQAQLASVKDRLAVAEKTLQAERLADRRPYTCLDGTQLVSIFDSVRKLDSDAAQAAIKKNAEMLDVCVQDSEMSEQELRDRLKSGKF
jgi:hypothetical protein